MKNIDARISKLRTQLTASIAGLEKKVADQKKKLAALDEVQSYVVDKLSRIESTGGAQRKKTAKKAVAPAKKTAARKTAAKKATVKRTAVKKAAASKAAAKATSAKKAAPAKKAATAKSTGSKAATKTAAADNGKPGMFEAIREALRRNRGPMAVNEIIAAVDGKTRSVPKDLARAVSATLSNLMKAGSVELVGVGQYTVK